VYLPFLTIQKAISLAEPTEYMTLIMVMPGEYYENLVFNKVNVTIQGFQDKDITYSTKLRGSHTVVTNNTASAERFVNGVTFNNIMLYNISSTSGTNLTVGGTGAAGAGIGYLSLNNCYISGYGGYGLRCLPTGCNYIIRINETKFRSAGGMTGPFVELDGTSTAAPIATIKNSVFEYSLASGAPGTLVKVGGYSQLSMFYCELANQATQASVLPNGLLWIANTPNGSSSNVTSITSSQFTTVDQIGYGAAGSPAIYVERNCPSVALAACNTNVRTSTPDTTACIVGNTGAGSPTVLNYTPLYALSGSAYRIDPANISPVSYTLIQ
jgi:hypothetical protein